MNTFTVFKVVDLVMRKIMEIKAEKDTGEYRVELGALTSYLNVDSQEYMAPGNRDEFHTVKGRIRDRNVA